MSDREERDVERDVERAGDPDDRTTGLETPVGEGIGADRSSAEDPSRGPATRVDETVGADDPTWPIAPSAPRRPIALPPPLERPAPVETRTATPEPRVEPPVPPREADRDESVAEATATAGPSPPAPPDARPEPEPTPPPPPREPFDAASLAAATLARSGEEDLRRNYLQVVQQVDRYVSDGYDPIVLVGYPTTGKTHALKALTYVLRGFEEEAREELQRELAPGQTEQWPFYRPVASPQGARWVFVDPGGELYARLRQNDWTYAEGAAGLFHTVSRCRGLLLMVNLKRGHLEMGPSGFGTGMTAAETRAEEESQKAHEELGFLDQFLLFVRALRQERSDVEGFLRKVADAPSLDAALREYGNAPRLDAPVAVLFTQADRLAEGKDFTLPSGDHLAPQSALFSVAPFVARNLPGLFASLLRHARRFKLDFVQSYVEQPTPGGEAPVWTRNREHLSVGLLPAVEFLERNLAPWGGRRPVWDRGIDTRTALRIHRLLHPGAWRGIEVDL